MLLEKHDVRPERSSWPRGVWFLLVTGFSPESFLSQLLLLLLLLSLYGSLVAASRPSSQPCGGLLPLWPLLFLDVVVLFSKVVLGGRLRPNAAAETDTSGDTGLEVGRLAEAAFMWRFSIELRRTEDDEEDARGMRVADVWPWDSL